MRFLDFPAKLYVLKINAADNQFIISGIYDPREVICL